MESFTRFGLVFAIAIAVGACATQGSYDEVVQERDQLQVDLDDANVQLDDAERQLASAQAVADEEAGRLAALIRELESEVATGLVAVTLAREGIEIAVSDDLLFASGSTDLSQAGRGVLRRIAGELKDMGGTVSVAGHTDNYMVRKSMRDRYPSNWELGAARAAKVVRRLSAEGVDPTRLRVVSYGPFHPVAGNDTEKGRRMNRRIAIVVR
ncbi:MAG: OmpA family protein [bacterium]|nr:OmpA family protein [bacterium]